MTSTTQIGQEFQWKAWVKMTHQTISFVKSGARIAGYILLVPFSFGLLMAPALALVLSELIGILEEIGHE